MQPHEQRVVDELDELEEKLIKLNAFIANPESKFQDLLPVDQVNLRKQRVAMAKYRSILCDRIARFEGSGPSAFSTECATFVRERDEAMLSLNEETIRANSRKWNGGVDSLPKDRLTFWVTVHKTITACTGISIEKRAESKIWLEDRGFSSMDDGEIGMGPSLGEELTVSIE